MEGLSPSNTIKIISIAGKYMHHNVCEIKRYKTHWNAAALICKYTLKKASFMRSLRARAAGKNGVNFHSEGSKNRPLSNWG